MLGILLDSESCVYIASEVFIVIKLRSEFYGIRVTTEN